MSAGAARWSRNLAEGEQVFTPRLIVLADETLSGPDLERVQDRLNLWLRHLVNTQLEPVLALEAPAEIEGTARGLAYRLYENLGILPRNAVADEVKGLDQEVRGKLRKLGVKFGAYHIYVPASLKPAPRELALILYSLKHGGVRQPGVTELPHIVLSGRTSFLIDPEVNPKLYELAGFKVAGRRAVRVDILERLADIIRPLVALDAKTHQGELPSGAAEGNGFRVTVEMTSLLGTAGDDFASILNSLGYRVRRTPKVVAPPAEAPETAASTAPETAPTDVPAEPESVAQPEAVAEPVAAAEPEAVAEAQVNAAAAEAVEGSAPIAEAAPVDEAGAVDSATADLGAPAPEPAQPPIRPSPPSRPSRSSTRSGSPPAAGPTTRATSPIASIAAARTEGEAGAAPAEGENANRPPRQFRRPGGPEGDAKNGRPRCRRPPQWPA